MMFNIITPDQRDADTTIKGVIFGPAKIGKTSLLWTLDPATTLFVDLEAGGLSVQGWQGDSIELRDWETARNFACFIGGPNPAMRQDQTYSQAHYEFVCSKYGDAAVLSKYKTVFIDSITVASRLAFQWSQGQPQALSEKTGKPDTRGAYGLLGQEMIRWITHLQHTKGKHIWFVGLLDKKMDDFNRQFWEPQMEGSKTALELPGIMDQVVTMSEMTPAEGAPYRAFVCSKMNRFGFPAGDRSGTLDEVEPPHLGRLMEKILAGKRKPIAEYTYTIQEQQL